MMRFFDFLFPPRVDELAMRAVSLDGFLAKVAPQLVSATQPGTVALLPFNDISVRAVIHEAKYHGSARAFDLLAAALIEYLRDCDETGMSRIRIVPVPLGTSRLRARGFNQIEEVAKRTASELGMTVDAALLIRTRETESQVSLPREKRMENMRGAFGAAHPVDPAYTYIVVDDVITTGATLQAAIDALKEAGAKRILPLALAH